MLRYPVKLTPDEDTLLVTSRDFPELTTYGETKDEALYHAVDAFEVLIAGRISRREDIPPPSKGRTLVTLRTEINEEPALSPDLDQGRALLGDAIRESDQSRARPPHGMPPNPGGSPARSLSPFALRPDRGGIWSARHEDRGVGGPSISFIEPHALLGTNLEPSSGRLRDSPSIRAHSGAVSANPQPCGTPENLVFTPRSVVGEWGQRANISGFQRHRGGGARRHRRDRELRRRSSRPRQGHRDGGGGRARRGRALRSPDLRAAPAPVFPAGDRAISPDAVSGQGSPPRGTRCRRSLQSAIRGGNGGGPGHGIYRAHARRGPRGWWRGCRPGLRLRQGAARQRRDVVSVRREAGVFADRGGDRGRRWENVFVNPGSEPDPGRSVRRGRSHSRTLVGSRGPRSPWRQARPRTRFPDREPRPGRLPKSRLRDLRRLGRDRRRERHPLARRRRLRRHPRDLRRRCHAVGSASPGSRRRPLRQTPPGRLRQASARRSGVRRRRKSRAANCGGLRAGPPGARQSEVPAPRRSIQRRLIATGTNPK